MARSFRAAVVLCGLGQTLRGDDAAGLEAVRRWRAAHPRWARQPWLRVRLLEVPELGLLEALEGAAAALLVDAVHSGAPPGAMHRLSAADVAAFGSGAGSAHGWGVAETLALARTLGVPLPPRLALLGVEAGALRWGVGLSPAVAAAMPQAVAAIQQWVAKEEKMLLVHGTEITGR